MDRLSRQIADRGNRQHLVAKIVLSLSSLASAAAEDEHSSYVTLQVPDNACSASPRSEGQRGLADFVVGEGG